uniref:Transposase Tc1-like domain-containing protein n=1 Tax=Cyprinus carpio carpio TaxID=630221 RepID=A0A9J7X9C7_CYPCA
MFLLQTQSTASAGPPRSGIGPSPQSSSGSGHLFSLCSVFFATLFFLPTDFPLRCFDTALWEQPIRSEISFCVLPSRFRVSMMSFWTAVRSAVLPMIAVLRKIVEKDRFQTLGDLRKQWTESGVETSRATVHRRVLLNQKQRQKRLTWATEKQHWTVAQWSKVLFSDESKFCMSFGNQGARVWRKTGEKEMPKCLKSSVKYPQSVMVWGAMSAAGVGPLCFIKGRVNAASYQEILEHFMLPSAEKLYGDEDFVFQHDLAPAHSAKNHW